METTMNISLIAKVFSMTAESKFPFSPPTEQETTGSAQEPIQNFCRRSTEEIIRQT